MSGQLYELVTLDALDALTRGETMARIAQGHRDALRATQQVLDFECLRAAQLAQSVESVANENICGLRPVAQIPRRLQAVWRAKFLTEDSAANIKGTTGFECWRDDGKNGFLTRFRKLNPELFHKEQKVTNKITTPGTAHLVKAGKYTPVREAAMA